MMNKKQLVYVFPCLLVLMVLFVALRGELHAATITIDQVTPAINREPLPTFSVALLFDPQKKFTTNDMKGRISLLNIWSAGCHFCREEHAFLLEISRDYHIPIYGLNFREDSSYAKDWLHDRGNPYTLIGMDSDGSVAMQLGLTGTPQTFVIDAQGMIRYRVLGMIDKEIWTEKIYPLIQKIKQE